MTQSDLRKKTIHALSWSFLESLGLQGIRFAIAVVLARILLPEHFGLIGMLAIFIAVSESFLDSGFGAALIQKREVTQTDTCSIFYFNIAIGCVVAGLLCLSAPWIAAFYREPLLTPLTRAMSIVIVLNSFALIHTTILQKKIDFKTLTKVSLMTSVLSGIVGVTLAMKGAGVWSLVYQQITYALLRTLFLWLLNPWRPSWLFSMKSMKQMFSFGSRLLASGLLEQIFSNIYLLVIGKLFSATDLGYFTRAKSFQDLPTGTLSSLVGRVTFPAFSAIQSDPARLKRGLKKALTLLVMVNFPVMIGLAAIARPLVLTLLTEKWAECIPYLQLLCFYGLLMPVHMINLNLLQALGRSDLFLRLEVIKKILVVLSIAVTWRWGIAAMIYGLLSMSVICYYLNSYYTGVLIDYTIKEQASDMSPYLIVSILMGAAVHLAGFISYPNDWSMLLTQVISGVAVYVFLCRMFKLITFMEIWQGGLRRMQIMIAGSAG